MTTKESENQDNVIKPRVGRILAGEVWTGGSNDPLKALKRPKTIFSRRPDDFRGASKIEETCRKGLEEDKRLGMGNNSPVSLTSWINLIKTYLEECGMDTVFHVWDPSTNVEVYLLE